MDTSRNYEIAWAPLVSPTVQTMVPPCRPHSNRGRRHNRPQLRLLLPPAVPPTVSAVLGNRLVPPSKGATPPPPMEHPFLPPPIAAIIELPQNATRSPSKLPVTTPSSAPTPRAPRTPLPVLKDRRRRPEAGE
jgi:hypothetical protein